MAAPIALIQGASRGLGLEFCRHILRNKNPAVVVATCRNPGGAAELHRLAEQHPGRVTVLRLDVDQEEEVRSAAARVKENFGGLDLLVNSSAMLHPSGRGETSLRDVSAQVKDTLKVMQHPLFPLAAQSVYYKEKPSMPLIVMCWPTVSHGLLSGCHIHTDHKHSRTTAYG